MYPGFRNGSLHWIALYSLLSNSLAVMLHLSYIGASLFEKKKKAHRLKRHVCECMCIQVGVWYIDVFQLCEGTEVHQWYSNFLRTPLTRSLSSLCHISAITDITPLSYLLTLSNLFTASPTLASLLSCCPFFSPSLANYLLFSSGRLQAALL